MTSEGIYISSSHVISSLFGSPYVAAPECGGSQRNLPLPVPFIPDGTVPKGFLGFAVNMIDLDADQLQIKTTSGHGLRETLFYCLFGQLQVYRTREEMLAARACIKHGAVSLDGGILKENSGVTFGTRYLSLFLSSSYCLMPESLVLQ